MSVCLYRDDGGIEWNGLSWRKLEELAELHGWTGFHSSRISTVSWTDSGECEWVTSRPRLSLVCVDGDSVMADGDFVSGQDARALAAALERALPNLPAEKRKLPYQKEIEFPDGSRVSGFQYPRPEPQRSGESDEAYMERGLGDLAMHERSIPSLGFFSGPAAIGRVTEMVEFMKRGGFAIE